MCSMTCLDSEKDRENGKEKEAVREEELLVGNLNNVKLQSFRKLLLFLAVISPPQPQPQPQPHSFSFSHFLS